ncbi:MAG: alpha/beta fold hydrolase [Deltaproteobacteria bacterium]|nr:alpha/beta fold hydrolase [Deltaproteobacteria bacterium]
MDVAHTTAAPDSLAPAPVALAERGLASRFLQLDGQRIHYLEAGQGPTLLLLHGAPQWSFTWRGVMAELAPHFRCIAPDMPGLGLSSHDPTRPPLARAVEQMERLVKALDLDRITLVANDTGGPVGFAVAGRSPERFSGFVAASTFGFTLDEFFAVRVMLRLVGSVVGRLANRHFTAIPRLAAGPGVPGRRLPRAEHQALLAPFGTRQARDACTDLLGALVREPAVLAQAQRQLAALSDRPLLTLFGEHDRARKAGFPDKFARLFPLHEHHVIAGANHFPQEDAPQTVAAHIQAWHRRRVAA